ncbi:hypothetical protein EAG_13420 [Camponotus floridanus]|uniref:Uncharacterized protein n=1 Tax=Camponotus floridanus TaxID=104421 RepID=E2A249_CAMFO|nr:hypothetical protein EAG_13420 [Camponotus floridanus]
MDMRIGDVIRPMVFLIKKLPTSPHCFSPHHTDASLKYLLVNLRYSASKSKKIANKYLKALPILFPTISRISRNCGRLHERPASKVVAVTDSHKFRFRNPSLGFTFVVRHAEAFISAIKKFRLWDFSRRALILGFPGRQRTILEHQLVGSGQVSRELSSPLAGFQCDSPAQLRPVLWERWLPFARPDVYFRTRDALRCWDFRINPGSRQRLLILQCSQILHSSYDDYNLSEAFQ